MNRPLRFGEAEVRPEARVLLLRGEPVALAPRAFDLLLALLERRDRVVGKDELLAAVWPDTVVEEGNLYVQVNAIRKALGADAIATVPGRGYQLLEPGDAARGDATPATASAGNLPASATDLIGRDAELAAVTALCETHPLVTVVGTGGMGKTTLGIAAGASMRARFPDGVWLVDLARLADAAQLAQFVARTLNVPLEGPGSAPERLVGEIAPSALLLILDNCEHLVDAAADLAARIVEGAPRVTILATTQELLNVPGEKLFRLGPLRTPDEGERADPDAHGAVGLFAERARAVDPGFSLDPETATAVADICRRLDGMPLAIELAAARVRLLGVTGVRDRLGERFQLLTAGARTSLRRHQTLRAMLEWSFGLLSDEEQAVLRRLSVFVGGFSLPLAQRVAADDSLDDWMVLELIGALADKSLVVVDGAGPVRYRLLETTRAYAIERLAERGETAATLRRHAHALRDLVVREDARLFDPTADARIADAVAEVGPELENVRAALDWSIAEPGEASTAAALAGAASNVLRAIGLGQEALDRLSAVLPLVDQSVDPDAAGLFWLGLFKAASATGQRSAHEMFGYASRAHEVYARLGLRTRLHHASSHLAVSLALTGDAEAAERVLAEIVALERDTDPPRMRLQRVGVEHTILWVRKQYDALAAALVAERATLRHRSLDPVHGVATEIALCAAYNALGRHRDAIETATEAIARAGQFHAYAQPYLAFHLCHAQVMLERFDDAVRTFAETIGSWRRAGLMFEFGAPMLACLLAARGRHAEAARADGSSRAHRRRTDHLMDEITVRATERLNRWLSEAGIDADEVARLRKDGESLDANALAAMAKSL